MKQELKEVTVETLIQIVNIILDSLIFIVLILSFQMIRIVMDYFGYNDTISYVLYKYVNSIIVFAFVFIIIVRIFNVVKKLGSKKRDNTFEIVKELDFKKKDDGL
jgi:hypothetical protein